MKDLLAIRWCLNCDKRPYYARGLCGRCYRWRRVHGVMRPRHLWDKARVIDFCDCGGVVIRSGKCWACATYEKKRGRPRPRRITERPRWCQTCGRPIGPNQRWHGCCQACDRYRRRTGHTRPAHLWGCNPDLGWCECGAPAAQRRTVRAMGKAFIMGYCSTCLEAVT